MEKHGNSPVLGDVGFGGLPDSSAVQSSALGDVYGAAVAVAPGLTPSTCLRWENRQAGRYYDTFVREKGRLLIRERQCVYDTVLIANDLVYPV